MSENKSIQLGLCCLNTTLRCQKPPIFSSRSIILRTLENKGIEFLQKKIIDNLNDTLKLIDWNEKNGIKVFRLSSELFPHKSNPRAEEYSFDLAIEYLKLIGAKYEIVGHEDLINRTSDYLIKEKAVGWFQGRMEFGPRALGGRSILGDPRSDKMQKNLNLKVKYRESFRPFAPSILREDLTEWFDLNIDSPYMLFVANINSKKSIEMTNEQNELFGIDKLNIKRSEIPAVTHVDYSARIQTVTQSTNKLYYDLISKFKEKTGCPVIVNTSFNVRGEPIVNTPSNAFNCFMGTDLDYLVIGNCILDKMKQDKDLKKNHIKNFELD